jgi:hypothetical protein
VHKTGVIVGVVTGASRLRQQYHYLRRSSHSLRHKFHIRCAILHQELPRTSPLLLLSVKMPWNRPHDVLGQRHVSYGLAHVLWEKEGIGAPNVRIMAHVLWFKTTL